MQTAIRTSLSIVALFCFCFCFCFVVTNVEELDLDVVQLEFPRVSCMKYFLSFGKMSSKLNEGNKGFVV